MLVRLNKSGRWYAAAALAALYLLCIVAPAAAFAFGDGTTPAHCLTLDANEHPAAHVHKPFSGKTVHVHADGSTHEHSKAPDDAGKTGSSTCCGLACLSALPASFVDLQTLARPATEHASVGQHGMTGSAPECLYRPPARFLSL